MDFVVAIHFIHHRSICWNSKRLHRQTGWNAFHLLILKLQIFCVSVVAFCYAYMRKYARIVSEKSNGLNKYWHFALQTNNKRKKNACVKNERRRVIYLICLVIISTQFSLALFASQHFIFLMCNPDRMVFNHSTTLIDCTSVCIRLFPFPFLFLLLFNSIYRLIETITQMNSNYWSDPTSVTAYRKANLIKLSGFRMHLSSTSVERNESWCFQVWAD